MSGHTQIQATVVARYRNGGWVGVALTGPSGVGKSSVALRLVAEGWTLVADDAALVWASGGQLWARPPQQIEGQAEVRGLGLVSLAHRDLCRLALIVRLGLHEPERLPEPSREIWRGVPLPVVELQARSIAVSRAVDLALSEALRRPASP
jgi:serine kinase of HPr protein (carbohydrate metabolism regulator)